MSEQKICVRFQHIHPRKLSSMSKTFCGPILYSSEHWTIDSKRWNAFSEHLASFQQNVMKTHKKNSKITQIAFWCLRHNFIESCDNVRRHRVRSGAIASEKSIRIKHFGVETRRFLRNSFSIDADGRILLDDFLHRPVMREQKLENAITSSTLYREPESVCKL